MQNLNIPTAMSCSLLFHRHVEIARTMPASKIASTTSDVALARA